MVNKRLLDIANRQKNPSLPVERVQSARSGKTKLTQILRRDENGKPKLDLIPIKETAVNTPTQKDYLNLMRVYECGGWIWSGENLPTESYNWKTHTEETCIESLEKFRYGTIEYNQKQGSDIISPREFYDIQNINPEMINEINVWFDENAQ